MALMILCIVPMKPLARAKARLGTLLSAPDRRRLSLAMLTDVIAAATGFDAVWVLHSDGDAAEVARAGGVEARPDATPDGGLNASLQAATAQAMAAGVTGILIVSADLPAITGEDLAAMTVHDGVALAPDRAGRGTNALWRCPGDAIPVAYGERSREAHELLARERGRPFAIVRRPRLALDVDTPEDLRLALQTGAGPATRAVLADLGPAVAGR